ncbi:MAG: type II toxin-antitoxin system RelE/ParE family toxin [Planctomycetaceae bacterium]|nr:type II toxin-antitoxin system RelE/ParE family toxin [Planctomycetaceae bacterium]
MTLHVVVTRRADADIHSIISWLANRSESGARSWFQALEATLDWLAENAGSCGLAPENDFFADEIRQHLFKTRRGRPYRLLFTIAGQQVRLLHVRGPGQDLVRPEQP